MRLKVPVPFNRYFKDKKKQEFKPVLFVGDSIIRFLTNVRNHVNVISLGINNESDNRSQ
jgi:hypothetical protein